MRSRPIVIFIKPSGKEQIIAWGEGSIKEEDALKEYESCKTIEEEFGDWITETITDAQSFEDIVQRVFTITTEYHKNDWGIFSVLKVMLKSRMKQATSYAFGSPDADKYELPFHA
ncbi:hypothetical protein PFISCL1PPCAC_18521 [Pristionchus fissidentatus]|uniref:Uncharacterized protein n=1 Tax=Pristionchus fissidentatus TaxID=1538716 RepID=A0AAV5W906_9BILA|nr:hypothetical protein PFISCL1PPCAC_18521 [Pristionchus fissidentatus]